MDISVIFEMFRGCNGYHALTVASCVSFYIVVRIIEEIRIKRNKRWVLKLI